jgi:hypothetical protein
MFLETDAKRTGIMKLVHNSREAAKELGPRRKPWVKDEKRISLAGAKSTLSC